MTVKIGFKEKDRVRFWGHLGTVVLVKQDGIVIEVDKLSNGDLPYVNAKQSSLWWCKKEDLEECVDLV